MVGPAWPWIGAGGNRFIEGKGALDRVDPVDVALPGVPVLVVPGGGWSDRPPSMPGLGVDDASDRAVEPAPWWYVELETGEGLVVDEALTVHRRVAAEPPPRSEVFDGPLADGVQVQLGPYEVALVEPTDRYPHGALGDRIEASAVGVVGAGGPTVDEVRFGPEAPTVIEGLSALLADATGDGRPEVLVTQSNAEVGAWLALWTPSGELVAESDPIGQANRWHHQIAIAPVGPEGEIEIVEVRTPHLGRTVQYHRVVGDRIELVADQRGYTSHRLGSRNLDEALVADADGEGSFDVVLPTGDRSALGILTRTDAGVEARGEVALPGRMTTNLAVAAKDGGIAFAVGTDAAVLRIWPSPTD